MGRHEKNHKPKHQIIFKPDGLDYILEFTKKGFTKESLMILEEMAEISENRINTAAETTDEISDFDDSSFIDPNKNPYQFSYSYCTIFHTDYKSTSPEVNDVNPEIKKESSPSTFEWDFCDVEIDGDLF